MTEDERKIGALEQRTADQQHEIEVLRNEIAELRRTLMTFAFAVALSGVGIAFAVVRLLPSAS